MTNSEKHGEIISYDKDGKIFEIAWYTNGVLVCQLDITDGKHSLILTPYVTLSLSFKSSN